MAVMLVGLMLIRSGFMAQSLSHDAAYRQIFGDRYMMRELIRGFVPPDLWLQWDLASLERKDSSWVGEGQARREGDLVWRVRSRGDYRAAAVQSFD